MKPKRKENKENTDISTRWVLSVLETWDVIVIPCWFLGANVSRGCHLSGQQTNIRQICSAPGRERLPLMWRTQYLPAPQPTPAKLTQTVTSLRIVTIIIISVILVILYTIFSSNSDYFSLYSELVRIVVCILYPTEYYFDVICEMSRF